MLFQSIELQSVLAWISRTARSVVRGIENHMVSVGSVEHHPGWLSSMPAPRSKLRVMRRMVLASVPGGMDIWQNSSQRTKRSLRRRQMLTNSFEASKTQPYQ